MYVLSDCSPIARDDTFIGKPFSLKESTHICICVHVFLGMMFSRRKSTYTCIYMCIYVFMCVAL